MRWLARGEIELPGHHHWLSARERDHLATIRFRKRRQEYLTRRWAAKHAVAEALELAEVGSPAAAATLATIEVRNHPSGAPWVAVDGEAAAVEVSLTDRAGWAVCLVGPAGASEALGVDLELVEPRTDRFVADFFTEREQRWVRSLAPGDACDAAANLVWSAKEAALKVLQVGLRADTRTVEVAVDDRPDARGWSPLTMTGADGDRFHGWWRRDGAFVLTLAARSPFAPPERLPGSADLARADPLHSWLDDPLVPDGSVPEPGV